MLGRYFRAATSGVIDDEKKIRLTLPRTGPPPGIASAMASFNQINRNTGHRIKYQKVDADTGEEVDEGHDIRPRGDGSFVAPGGASSNQ
ncbi:MAG: hypothetical protein JWQ07_5721 [Ramlibacter sp.]|nr:hypothetical protein [Ramlibacter sp.]